MNLAFDHADVRRVLPKTWEFFRAISGLVAVVVLVGIATSTPRLSEQPNAPALELAGVTASAPLEPTRALLTNIVPAVPAARSIAFYLVSTPAQEASANSDEYFGAMEASNGGYLKDRQYIILYARTPEEEQAAGRAILDALDGLAGPALVEINDLRSGGGV